MIDNKIMVCVTVQKNCERLIKFGEEMASSLNGKLYVIHVTKKGTNFLGNPDESEALEFLYQISNNAGADMAVLRSSNVTETIVNFANENNITHAVLGEAPKSKKKSSIIDYLKAMLPDITFEIVPS